MGLLLAKALLIGLLIAAAETIQGILRLKFLNRRLGDKRARRVAVIPGSLIILLIAWGFAPWIGIRTPLDALAIGLLWVGLMLTYDLALGRWFFHFSWARLRADFDPRTGGMLGFGMVVLALAPWLAGSWHGWW